MKRKLKKVLVLSAAFTALNLIPLAANAATNPPPAAKSAAPVADRYVSMPDDLNPSDFGQYLRGDVALQASSDGTQISISGKILKACARHFSVNVEEQSGSASQYGTVAFRVTDLNASGRKCLDQHKGEVCNAGHPCSNLSDLMKVQPYQVLNKTYGYNFEFVDADGNGTDQHQNKGSVKSVAENTKAVSDAALAAANDAKQKATTGAIARAQAMVSAICSDQASGNWDDAATDAQLLQLVNVKQSDIDKIIAQNYSDQLTSIGNCIQSTSSTLADCMKDLDGFASEHSGDVKFMAIVSDDYVAAALRAAKGGSPADYKAALLILKDAQGRGGITDSRKDDIKTLIKENKMENIVAMEAGGKMTPDLKAAQKEAASDAKSDYNDALKAYKSSCYGKKADPDDCRQASSDLQAAMQEGQAAAAIPYQTAFAAQQTAQMNAQMNSQMNQALQGIGQPQVGGNSSAPGISNGGPQISALNPSRMQTMNPLTQMTNSNPMSQAGMAGVGMQYGQMRSGF